MRHAGDDLAPRLPQAPAGLRRGRRGLTLPPGKPRDSFGASAGVPGSPHSSLDQRLASRLLDEEVTSAYVGARRLTYEAWHYEWGDSPFGSGALCRAPDCAEKHWPVTGRP
ncbi:MAG: hypothetical protein KGM24_03680 [Elusimicrobia bacterium]|nr:hypothetical protein [Elusimicrobiota bacterium]